MQRSLVVDPVMGLLQSPSHSHGEGLTTTIRIVIFKQHITFGIVDAYENLRDALFGKAYLHVDQ